MFVTYITHYSGDKLPPFYVGSTTAARIEEGYHGSVRSKKYRAAWEAELQEHPELFGTVIDESFETREESLEAELALQKKLNVVRSPLFANMAYARGGFINPGKGNWAAETIERMRVSAKLRGQPKPHHENKVRVLLGPEEQKRRATEKRRAKALLKKQSKPVKAPKVPKVYVAREEINRRISAALQGHVVSKETAAKIGKNTSEKITGQKQSPEHAAKRAASRKKTLEARKK